MGSTTSAISKSANAKLKSSQLVGAARNARSSEIANNTRALPNMLHRAIRAMREQKKRDSGKEIVEWLVLLIVFSIEIRVGVVQFKDIFVV